LIILANIFHFLFSLIAHCILIYIQQLKTNPSILPFSRIVNCNIGNPQQLGQKPITFFRQVCSLLDNAERLLHSNLNQTRKSYPADAIERALSLLESMGGSTGAYSHSQGIPSVRDNVAKFIEGNNFGHFSFFLRILFLSLSLFIY